MAAYHCTECMEDFSFSTQARDHVRLCGGSIKQDLPQPAPPAQPSQREIEAHYHLVEIDSLKKYAADLCQAGHFNTVGLEMIDAALDMLRHYASKDLEGGSNDTAGAF